LIRSQARGYSALEALFLVLPRAVVLKAYAKFAQSVNGRIRNPFMNEGYPVRMSRVVEAVALCPKRQELFAGYPGLEPEGVRQALECAAQSLDERVTPLEPA